MKENDCVSFILIQGNRFLVEKRSLSKKTDPGLVAIPGGHCEAGESIENTLFRETEEELGIKPVQYQFVCTLFHKCEELQKIFYFAITNWSGTIQNNEAESLHWATLENTPKIELIPDRIAINEYIRIFQVIVLDAN